MVNELGNNGGRFLYDTPTTGKNVQQEWMQYLEDNTVKGIEPNTYWQFIQIRHDVWKVSKYVSK